jgi:predicted nucleic acid-binding protein
MYVGQWKYSSSTVTKIKTFLLWSRYVIPMTQSSKFVWDTSALISAVRSHDPFHLSCHQFMQEHAQDIHVFPTIAWFELQATLSRLERDGKRVLRELYLIDEKNYVLDIDIAFIQKASDQNLHIKFSSLRGADLIFACAAVIERATLITRDRSFLELDGLNVIIPPTPVDEHGRERNYWDGHPNPPKD